MISKQLIIIPFFSQWDHLADFELQTSKLLSRKNKVLVFHPSEARTIFMILKSKTLFKNFIRDIKSLKDNLTYFPVLKIIPFDRFLLIKRLNKSLMINSIKIYAKLLHKKPILWIFHPSFENLVGKFDEKINIYDCVDFHSSVDKKENSIITRKEKRLIKKSDIIFTNSQILFKLKKKLHPKCFQVPLGFDFNSFLKNKTNKIPQDLEKIRKPRIGFVGNIDYRVDFKLIYKLAKSNPQWSFLFIGPTNHEDIEQNKIINFSDNLQKIRTLKNIYLLGPKQKQYLKSYYDNIDIGFIPYDIKQKFCLYSYPMKIFEFFFCQVPVVSTPIISLMTLKPLVKIAENENSFSNQIKLILKNGWSNDLKKRQKEMAIKNSWNNKLETISALLEKV